MSSVAGLAGQQESRPQFRTGVELVQLDVTVLDNQRRPVTGLSASDFTVLDDGVETPIRAFTPVELARPLAAPPVWAGDISPDAVTNQATREDGRLLVILLDRSIVLGTANRDRHGRSRPPRSSHLVRTISQRCRPRETAPSRVSPCRI